MKKYKKMEKRMKKIITIIFLVILIIKTNISETKIIDATIIKIDNEIITINEIKNIIENKVKNSTQFLTKKNIYINEINNILINVFQKRIIKEKNTKINSGYLYNTIKQISVKTGNSIFFFKMNISKNKIQYINLRKFIKNEIIFKQIQNEELKQKITIKKKLIKENKNNYKKDKYNLSYILINKKDIKKKENNNFINIIKDINNGEKIKNIINKYNINGGNLNWRNFDEIPNILTNEINSLIQSKTVGPIITKKNI